MPANYFSLSSNIFYIFSRGGVGWFPQLPSWLRPWNKWALRNHVPFLMAVYFLTWVKSCCYCAIINQGSHYQNFIWGHRSYQHLVNHIVHVDKTLSRRSSRFFFQVEGLLCISFITLNKVDISSKSAEWYFEGVITCTWRKIIHHSNLEIGLGTQLALWYPTFFRSH